MLNTYPPLFINNYIWDKLKSSDISTRGYGRTVPFFPVFDNTATNATWEDKCYVVYDSMARFQMSPFYPIKREHCLYSVRGPIDKVLTWRDFIIRELDRGDDAGKDLNNWAGFNYDPKVFFHDIRCYQMEFGRDATRRTATTNTNFFSAELIIDYRFHIND